MSVFIFVIYAEYRVELAINLTEPLVRVESWSLAIQTGAVVNYVTQSVEDLCILCELNKLLWVQRNVNHPSKVCLNRLSIQISWAIRKINPAWDTHTHKKKRSLAVHTEGWVGVSLNLIKKSDVWLWTWCSCSFCDKWLGTYFDLTYQESGLDSSNLSQPVDAFSVLPLYYLPFTLTSFHI